MCCVTAVLQTKNALALKLEHIPKEFLLVLHDNAYLNEVGSTTADNTNTQHTP